MIEAVHRGMVRDPRRSDDLEISVRADATGVQAQRRTGGLDDARITGAARAGRRLPAGLSALPLKAPANAPINCSDFSMETMKWKR